MEWAVGKQYDVYRPNTGKLLLPGAKIWWEIHYHAVGEEITRSRRAGGLSLSQRRGAQISDLLDDVQRGVVGTAAAPLDIPPNTDRGDAKASTC